MSCTKFLKRFGTMTDKSTSLWEFVQQPIPLTILALILGLLGVKSYTPLLVICEIVLIYDFYRYGISLNKKWLRSVYLIFILVTSAILGGADYLLVRQDQSAEVSTSPSTSKVSCLVENVQFEPAYRFYQDPPVYYQKLDTFLRLGITNQTGKPLYIREHSAMALLGIEWMKFKNSDSGAFEPYAFGLMESNFLVRFNLLKNGFDYVTRERPLAVDESLDLWMFFISGLSISDRPNISQFKFTFHDSGGEEFPCTSEYSIKTDKGTVVGSPQMSFLRREPIPPNMKEEPAH
jgi:hypothetical protein